MNTLLPALARTHSKPSRSTVDVRTAGVMGRGVYACEEVPADTVLGRFESIELSPNDQKTIENTTLNAYIWQHKNKPDWALLPFGWISFLNHSRNPNCRTHWSETNAGWVAEIRSTTAIKMDEQLFIDYGCTDDELGFIPESR